MSTGVATAPRRILFVFAWLAVGGEETEVRLLARTLDPVRYRIEVLACFRKPGMACLTQARLSALGIPVDCTPYDLSFEDTVDYLASKMVRYDLVVACQAVVDVYPALERMARPPPLIEHGGLVSEALAGPKHLTARYVGVCATIRDAAASCMPERPHHAIEIPSMVDLTEFDPAQRTQVRAEWGCSEDALVIGWVGRLDAKKRVEDFIRAAGLVRERHSSAYFIVIGGSDAFMPEYAQGLRELASGLQLNEVLHFLGDRCDVPRLLAGLDAFVWLSRGEGMPHVIAEAGAAALPVVATRDNGSIQQIRHGETGLFVPHEEPSAVAATLCSLIEDPDLRRRLGAALRRKVERDYSAPVLAKRWEALFETVLGEARTQPGC